MWNKNFKERMANNFLMASLVSYKLILVKNECFSINALIYFVMIFWPSRTIMNQNEPFYTEYSVVDYPCLLTNNVVFGFIPLIYGNRAIYQRVRLLLCAQNEVVSSLVKDKIMKMIVSLIPLLGSGGAYIKLIIIYIVFLVFIYSVY